MRFGTQGRLLRTVGGEKFYYYKDYYYEFYYYYYYYEHSVVELPHIEYFDEHFIYTKNNQSYT